MVQCALSLLALLLTTTVVFSQTYTFDLRQNYADGVYESGETIIFSPRLLKDGEPVFDKGLRCILYLNGKEVSKKDFPAGEDVAYRTALDKPGWCHLAVIGLDSTGEPFNQEVKGKSKQVRRYYGAIVAPLAIQVGAPEPSDFDAYWAKEKQKLEAIPHEAKRTAVLDVPEHLKTEYVEIPVGSGFRPVNAVVRMPANAEAKSLPIQLYVHGAGVRGPTNSTWAPWMPEASGLKGHSLFMNLNAHGIPNDESKEYYQALNEGELKNYPFLNSDDPEKFYMKGLVLRLIRALEFLKAQPEWNGRDIVVRGGSQGGAQALIAGGIDPDVTFVYADVPAMCDYGGTLVGRSSGWPRLYEQWPDGRLWLTTKRESREKLLASVEEIQHLGYFDAANFARRIHGRAVLYTGGIDGTCPPTSVFAAYNNIPNDDKSIIFDPLAGHGRRSYEGDEAQNIAHFVGDRKLADGDTP